MIKEIKKINRENIHEIASFFSNENQATKFLAEYKIIDQNEHGTYFIENKIYDDLKFAIHKKLDENRIDSITFFEDFLGEINIYDLKQLYPIYHRKYLPHDDEIGYAFKSVSKNYIIEAYLKAGKEVEKEERDQILRLTIRCHFQ